MAETRSRAGRIVASLRRLYPEAHCALTHRNVLELLVATVLSAQCTDERVNRVTPRLFRKYRTAADWAAADLATLEREIHSTGFFRMKAKALVGIGKALVERHGGEVPATMESLVALPGVARKTASVVLGIGFGIPAIPVDTHVGRLARRLGLTTETDPVKIERDLREILPEEDWIFAASALILHGRRVCAARKPACDRCALRPDCPFPEPPRPR